MKCALCTNKAEKEGLCSKCFSERHILFELPAKFQVKACRKCGSVFLGNKWSKADIKAAAEKTILQEIKINPDYDKIQVDIEFEEGKELIAHITVYGEVGKEKVHHTAKRDIKIAKQLCKPCSEQSANAYQAILQLRGTKERIAEAELFSKAEISKRENVVITKEVKLKEGKDLYINSNTFTVGLLKKLLEKFGGMSKVNEKTYSISRATSKTMYRLAILFRIFPFRKDDIIRMENDIVRMVSIGRNLKGVSIKTGRTINFKYEEDMKLEEVKPIPVHVSQTKPRIMVIHPETYQPVPIENASMITEIKDVYNVVIDEGRVYVV